MNYELISKTERTHFYKDKNKIKLVTKLNLTNNANNAEEKINKIRILLYENNFFRLINELNSDIITIFSDNKKTNSVSYFIKNILDQDDEELQCICFNYLYNFVGKNIDISCKITEDYNLVLEELNIFEGDYDIVKFDIFEIKISEESIIFDFDYDSDQHPGHVGNIVGRFFQKIFDNFADYVDETL